MADYCTQSDIEKYLNITFNIDPDPTVSAIITHVSALIDSYCNRDFTSHSNEIEYHDGKGKGHNVIILKNYPVLAVNSVVEDGTTLTETTHYIWFEDGRIIKCSEGYVDADEWYWKAKLKTIKVDYNYGYTTVPQEIKTIAIQLCVEWLKKYPFKFTETGTANTVSMAGVNVNYSDMEILPEWAKKRLNHYKKRLTW